MECSHCTNDTEEVAGRLPKLGAPNEEQLPEKLVDPAMVMLPPISSEQPGEPRFDDPLTVTEAFGKYSTPLNGRL
jgi:hypothetical protein